MSLDNALALPNILKKNGYYVEQFHWDEKLKLSEDENGGSFLSVYQKIDDIRARQVATVRAKNGKIALFSGNGWYANSKYYYGKNTSGILEDGDEQKFIEFFKQYVKDLSVDPYAERGFLDNSVKLFSK